MSSIDLSSFDDVAERLAELRKDIGATQSNDVMEVINRIDELADILGNALSLIRDKLAEAAST